METGVFFRTDLNLKLLTHFPGDFVLGVVAGNMTELRVRRRCLPLDLICCYAAAAALCLKFWEMHPYNQHPAASMISYCFLQ